MLNLQPIDGLVTFIMFCVCVNCFISYPLQIMAAFDIAEQHPFFKNGNRLKLKKVLMRSCVIVAITGIALIIPDFTVFLDIAGALGAGVIAFILPPLLYNHEFRDEIGAFKKYSNYGIVVFGLVGCTLSIYASIKEIINGDVDD